MIYQNIFW